MQGLPMKRVVIGAVAILGGYLFFVRVALLASFDPDWLPYAAQLVGALIMGGVLARQGTRHRYEALVAGLLSVAIVGTVSFASPSTFGWVAARSSHPVPIAIALALGCGAAAQLGARLSYGKGGMTSLVMLSIGISFAALLFGARLAVTLVASVVTITNPVSLGIVYVLAFLAGFATQLLVPTKHAGACSSGVALLLALQVIELEIHGGGGSQGLVWLVLAVAAAFVGSIAAQSLPQPAVPDVAAFD